MVKLSLKKESHLGILLWLVTSKENNKIFFKKPENSRAPLAKRLLVNMCNHGHLGSMQASLEPGGGCGEAGRHHSVPEAAQRAPQSAAAVLLIL